MSIPITQHFELGEFECHDGTPYPPEWIQDRLVPLCGVLETIRAACGGRAITIISGYRTPKHNNSLIIADGSGSGVAQNSQHLVGKAADIRVDGLAPSDVLAVVRQLDTEKKIKIGGLGLYQGWVHVDIRDRPADGHLAQWKGTGVA